MIPFLLPVYALIYGLGYAPEASFLLALALTVAVVTPLAWISYMLIERPGILASLRIVDGLGRRAQPATPYSSAPAGSPA